MSKGPEDNRTPSQQEVATSDPTDLSGQTLGDFHLLRRLGEGGMGQVYLAEQLSLKRRVALKLLRGDLANNETSRKRFEVEAKAVASLTHANVVQVYAAGEQNGLLYMALEYVDGRNLRDYLSRKGTLDVPHALSIMRQVSAALIRAGELGIIHRDIKPENILLTRKGEVKVADFGLSRVIADKQPALNLTQSGVALGTPLYMSPEQVEGKPLDPRADIYSFGVTCYHMLAGQPPFEGDNAFAVAIQHVQTEPMPLESIRPDLPRELCAIVARMMAKKPEDRYQTARDVLRDLRRLEAGGTLKTQAVKQAAKTMEAPIPRRVAATVPMPARLAGDPSRRLSWAATLVLTVAATVSLAAGAGSLLGWYFRPPPAEAPSEGAQEQLPSTKQREDALKEVIQSSSEKPGDNMQLAIASRVDLGLIYLEQRRLDEAEKFFAELGQSKVEQFALLGKLGQAMVLAFRDKPQESFDQFQALTEMLRPLSLDLRPYPEMTKMLSKALSHNLENLQVQGQPWPRDLLQRLTRVQGLAPAVFLALQAQVGRGKQSEAALLVLIDASKNPGTVPNKDLFEKLGVRYRMELGLLYLEQRDKDPGALKKAETFFRGESQSNVEPYQMIGKLGEALVLAFQKKPAESVTRFQEYVKKPGALATLQQTPEVRKLVAEAMLLNEQGLKAQGQQLPKELEPLRRANPVPIPLPPRERPMPG